MRAKSKAPLVDRALARIGLSRAKHRATRSVYAGANISRLNSDWITANLSADQSIRGDFRLLRERSRALVRDNAYAARFIDLWQENVVGPAGIRLQSRVKNAAGELDKETNRSTEAAWNEWSLPENASVDGLLSLTDIASLSAAMWKQDGEALIRICTGFENRFGFSLQVLDADLLDHNMNQVPSHGVNEIRMGVERDEWGRPVAYWLWSSHESESFGIPRQRMRLPANEVIHLYTVKRPGQTRGIPAFASVMSDINMLGGYQEAELVAARTAAAQMFFIAPDKEDDSADVDAPRDLEMEAEPGQGHRLAPGETVHQFSPEHPVSAFGAFVKAILRSISSGLGVSYSALTGDLEGANYGSLRDGSLKERDAYKRAQIWISIQLYRRVYLSWLPYALLSQQLKVGTMLSDRLKEHVWLARGWPWIDPEKDISAASMAIREGFDTRTSVCAANGRDFEDNIETLAHEQEIADEYGVTLTPAAGSPSAPSSSDASTKPKNETDPDADEEDDARSADLRVA